MSEMGQSRRTERGADLVASSTLHSGELIFRAHPGMTSVFVNYLQEQARWFVFCAWLFCLITSMAGVPIGAIVAISDAYGREVYPRHKIIVSVIGVAIITSLVVAISGSIAFASGHRTFASLLVFAANAVSISVSMIAVFLAPRGPQDYSIAMLASNASSCNDATNRPTRPTSSRVSASISLYA